MVHFEGQKFQSCVLSQLMRENFVKYKGILPVGWFHLGSLKSAMVERFIQKLSKVINSISFFFENWFTSTPLGCCPPYSSKNLVLRS